MSATVNSLMAPITTTNTIAASTSSAEAELHIVGEVTGATNFKGHSFIISYEIVTGTQWKHLEGTEKGTSHVMENTPFSNDGLLGSSSGGGGGEFAWSLPIDVHYRLSSVQGWPKISVQVWSVDEYGRKDLAGYGVAFLPMPGQSTSSNISSSQTSYNGTAGTTRSAAGTASNGRGGLHKIVIETWKPTYSHGNFATRIYQQVRQMVMGGNPVLRDDSLVYNNDQRYKLHTMSSGHVNLHVSVMMRNARAVGLSTSIVN